MIFKPEELKLIHIGSLAPGSVASVAGREVEVPFIIRLKDSGTSQKFMVLGGASRYKIMEWSGKSHLASQVCSSSDLRIELGEPYPHVDRTRPGTILVYEQGATIVAAPEGQSDHGIEVSLSSWEAVSYEAAPRTFVAYRDWSFGNLNFRGEFEAFYHRSVKKSP